MVVVRTGGTMVAPWWHHPTTTFAPAIRHLAWSIQRVCHPHRGICPVLCFFIHIDSSIQKMIIRRTRDPNVPLNRLFWFCFIVYTSEGLDWTPFKLLRRNFWNVSFVPPPFAAAPPAIEMEHLLAQRGAAATLYTCALYFMFRLNTLYLICHILYWSREGQLLVPSTFTWKDWNSIEECEKNVSSSTILLLDFVIRAQSEGWHHFVTIERLRLTPEAEKPG